MTYRILRVVLDHTARISAQRAVQAAVKAGALPNLKRRRVQCADCTKRAVVYDHRRYSDPLNVQPVCKGHNSRRGFALDQTFRDAITGESRTAEDYRAERRGRVRLPTDHILSAVTGRPGYLKASSERAHWKGMRVRGRKLMGRERRNAYLNTEHQYCLQHGHVDTGHHKTMTGLEALKLNRAAERDFIAQIQTDKAKRMFRWCLVKPIERDYIRMPGKRSPVCSHKRFGRA